jgi:hypothetical protein
MSLATYLSKRVFTETPEPVGRVRRSDRRRIFVVQKHDASNLKDGIIDRYGVLSCGYLNDPTRREAHIRNPMRAPFLRYRHPITTPVPTAPGGAAVLKTKAGSVVG